MPEASDERPTLYEWAGGHEALERLIEAFYDRVEDDELLSPLFGGSVGEEHRRNVTAWWCEVFGGPAGYTDELGGYDRMVGKHRGLAITSEQRFRFASLMSLAADDAGLLVNATSLGLRGEDLPAELGPEPAGVVLDLVYGEEPTALCRWADAQGARVVEGLEVLVRQGARSLEQWTGRTAPLDAMRRAARAV